MEYLYGSGLLFAAFLSMSAFGVLTNRLSTEVAEQRFGAAEFTALFVTAISTLGLAVILEKALQDWSVISIGELIFALGLLAVACIVTSRTLKRLFPHAADAAGERPINPSAPAGDRPVRGAARRAARPQMKRAA